VKTVEEFDAADSILVENELEVVRPIAICLTTISGEMSYRQ